MRLGILFSPQRCVIVLNVHLEGGQGILELENFGANLRAIHLQNILFYLFFKAILSFEYESKNG